MPVSPQTFANQLGLLGDKHYIYLLEKPEERLAGAVQAWAERGRYVPSQWVSEFGACYLPELLEAFLHANLQQKISRNSSVYSKAISILFFQPCFFRYMRIHPDRQAVFDKLVLDLDALAAAVESGQHDQHLVYLQKNTTAVYFAIIHSDGVDNRPPLPPLRPSHPSTFPATSRQLEVELQSISTSLGGSTNGDYLLAHGPPVAAFLEGVKSGADLLAEHDPWDERNCRIKSWEKCQYDVYGEHGCRPSDGSQMMVCARCLSVRYCSREHQRADWKEHKPICFAPQW